MQPISLSHSLGSANGPLFGGTLSGQTRGEKAQIKEKDKSFFSGGTNKGTVLEHFNSFGASQIRDVEASRQTMNSSQKDKDVAEVKVIDTVLKGFKPYHDYEDEQDKEKRL